MRARVRPPQPSPVRFNMTPMIDVVFLLIVFFMLVNRFSSAENVKIAVPDPHKSQAVETTIPRKVVVNVQYSEEGGASVLLLGGRVAGLEEIARRIAAQKEESPDLEVVVRADKRVPYQNVRQVMEVIAAERIEVFHIVAKPDGVP